MISKHASDRKLFAYALEERQGQNLGCSGEEVRIQRPNWLLLHPPAPPVIWSWVLWFAVFANNGSMSYHASGSSGLLVLSVSEMAGFVGSCATHHLLSEMRKQIRAFPPPSSPHCS